MFPYNAGYVVMMDLMLVVAFGGRERTAEEHRVLLEAAGFHLARTIRLGATAFIIVEVPPI